MHSIGVIPSRKALSPPILPKGLTGKHYILATTDSIKTY